MLIKQFFVCLLLSSSYASPAQTKQKAEKEFTAQLNYILKNSRQQLWSNEGVMSIDSLFTISKAGILSSTLRYTKDTGYYKVRMEVPVNKIQDTFWDLYIGLECNSDAVKVFETDYNSDKLIYKETRNLIHIGIIKKWNGYAEQEKLKKALNKLLKYYAKM